MEPYSLVRVIAAARARVRIACEGWGHRGEGRLRRNVCRERTSARPDLEFEKVWVQVWRLWEVVVNQVLKDGGLGLVVAGGELAVVVMMVGEEVDGREGEEDGMLGKYIWRVTSASIWRRAQTWEVGERLLSGSGN